MRLIPLLLCLWAPPASAQTAARMRLDFLGWKDPCSAALALYGYAKWGEGMSDEPVTARIGTLSFAPGERTPRAEWLVDWDGAYTWDAPAAEQALKSLAGAGALQPGYVEGLSTAPVAPGRQDVADILLSTLAFKTTTAVDPQGARLSAVYYSPSETCALLVYSRPGRAGSLLSAALIRVGEAGARLERARAHLSNALLLFDRGEAAAAVEESGIAAAAAPQDAVARYHHAALLCLSGEIDGAIMELEAAVVIDPRDRQKARKDKDFESLLDDPRFKALTAP